MSYFDFAKNLTLRALGPQGPDVSFTVGDPLDFQSTNTPWMLHKGTKKDDKSPVLVFVYDMAKTTGSAFARNALKRAKTIRYPDMLRFVDGIEHEGKIYLGTEYAEPLSSKIGRLKDKNLIKHGIYRIALTLGYMNEDANLIHGNLNSDSIFVTKAGEWKLGGLDYVCSLSEQSPILVEHGRYITLSNISIPPEIRSESWSGLKSIPSHAVDSWAFGCLIYEIYNQKPSKIEDLMIIGLIPSELVNYYKRFLSQSAKSRLSFKQFLETGKQYRGFFDDDFIKTTIFLEELQLKTDSEKESFISNLSSMVEQFPSDFCKYKILPEVIKGLEFGGVNPKALETVLEIGSNLQKEDYTTIIIPVIIRLFGSNDRAIRASLCQLMSKYIEYLSESDIDKIFNSIIGGFSDVNPAIREQSLKAVTELSPKLNARKVNDQLVKLLGKLQNDPEPGIRTNTIVCLVKISRFISSSGKSKILSTAFLKGLQDQFPFTKKAALMVCMDEFNALEAATRILPCICPLLIHQDKLIREQATKAVTGYLSKVEKFVASGQLDVPEAQDPSSSAFSSFAKFAVGSVSNTNGVGKSEPESKVEITSTKPAAQWPAKQSAKVAEPATDSQDEWGWD